jgi:uncharacterized membrane protein YoaK (UPF0700 family)
VFEHKLDESADRRVFFHWYMMAFNGGCINAGGVLAAGRFVSHVTGFATMFGINLAHGEFEAAAGILSVPVFFLMGAMIAGLLIDRRSYLGKKPQYEYVMLGSAFCLAGAACIGIFNEMPAFGQNFHLKQTYLLLVLLCLASGLQNAAITSSSGNSVRTTHLTGIITDLGLGIARRLTVRGNDPRSIKERHANWLRIGTIISFAMGSAVAALLFMKIGYYGFIFPCCISLYAALQSRSKGQASSAFSEL